MAIPATSDIVSIPRFQERKVQVFQFVEARARGFEEILERHPVPAWGVFSLIYFAWVLFVSNRKQLWFDELVSFSVDHVPTWGDAWRALQIGVDANPPLFHFVNRLLLAVLGDYKIVERGSSILGFWALSLCVYRIVRRNHSAAAAWVAALFPACSGAAYYATEARPYGMVLGLVSLAVICWLNAVETTGDRRWWLAGLTVSIAAAISSHYYAVFAIAPFLGAEATRAVKRNKVDWAIVGALLASYLPLILFWKAGLMAAANQYTGDTMAPSLMSPILFWELIFGPVAASILMAVAISLAWGWLSGKALSGGASEWRLSIAPSLTLLIAAWFCAIPIVVIVAARFVTHAYGPRYALTGVIGAAILIGAASDTLRKAIPGAAGLAILCLLCTSTVWTVMGRHKPQGRYVDYAWAQVAEREPNLPILYGGHVEFVQGWYNAPTEELKRRIMTVVDVPESRIRTGSTTADLGVINLAPAMPIPYEEYGKFIAKRKPFYVVYQPAVPSWITQRLVEDGAHLQLMGLYGANEIYRADWR